ncbi:MAG: ACT domain-containing protein, partial [Spirochaetia bacterium]|nr:ACT domain-containing protein [Spirochaetia bacterium]
MNSYILTVTCPDQSGIIAAITNCIASNKGNILNLAQHTATDIGMFFCRIVFVAQEGFSESDFHKEFGKVGEHFSMKWHIFNRSINKRVAILVSKTSHCLYELLLKHADGE